MVFPSGIGVIDTMVAIPSEGFARSSTKALEGLLRDSESATFDHPASYMFKDLPKERFDSGGAASILPEMDRYGIEKALIGVSFDQPQTVEAMRHHSDRFIGCAGVDPNQGMRGIASLTRAVEELGARSASVFPAGCSPQIPINDRRMYPIYAKCIELDIAIFVNAGVPGPRVPFQCQHVELIDEVCYDFPELRFVTRHGCEPWEALAVKLMLKWPNLYYSTSAFAPKHYPKAIIDYANTRGADKIMYAGYFPMGLSLERIFRELPDVPFKDDVWPKFLRENAARVLKL